MTGRLSIETVLPALREALAAELPEYAALPLEPLADTGLAHWHVRLKGMGLLARIPKQSQMQLSAEDNLAYQRAAFARASASGHAPRVHHLLRPGSHLGRGALIVDEIIGRAARLPEDLTAIVQALAAVHRQTRWRISLAKFANKACISMRRAWIRRCAGPSRGRWTLSL
jgi:hypothetical protein